jgi:hypothetical protein
MKTHRLIQAVALATLLFGISYTSAPASAASQVEQAFEALKAQRDKNRGYFMDMLLGAGIALDWANLTFKSKGQAPLYCIPQDVSLNAHNYADIALQEFERRPEWYKHPLLEAYPNDVVVNALAYGLKTTFPCRLQSE